MRGRLRVLTASVTWLVRLGRHVGAIPPIFHVRSPSDAHPSARAQGPRSRSRSPTPTSQGVRPPCPASGTACARHGATTHTPPHRQAQESEACTSPKPVTEARRRLKASPPLSIHLRHRRSPRNKKRSSSLRLQWSCVLGSLARSQPPSPFVASQPRLEPGTLDSESERSTVRPPQKKRRGPRFPNLYLIPC